MLISFFLFVDANVATCYDCQEIDINTSIHQYMALRGGHIVVVPTYASMMYIIKHYYYYMSAT